MDTRKITVTAVRYYTKETTIEIDVPIDIKDEELIDFLNESEELNNEIEEGLYESSLDIDKDEFQFQDPTNNFGGHL